MPLPAPGPGPRAPPDREHDVADALTPGAAVGSAEFVQAFVRARLAATQGLPGITGGSVSFLQTLHNNFSLLFGILTSVLRSGASRSGSDAAPSRRRPYGARPPAAAIAAHVRRRNHLGGGANPRGADDNGAKAATASYVQRMSI